MSVCRHPQTSIFSKCLVCSEIAAPPETTNHFELFGLSSRYSLDPEELQSKYYELSRRIHPDRFQTDSPKNLEIATHWFARLNKAFDVLRSDLERARYLLELSAGQDTRGQVKAEPGTDRQSLPVDMAEDYFELQEALTDENLNVEEKSRLIKIFEAAIKDRIAVIDEQRDSLFKKWENLGASLEALSQDAFKEITLGLDQRSYLKSMAQDLEKKCLRLS